MLKKPCFRIIRFGSILSLCAASSPFALADDGTLFPFVIPWDDASEGTVTNVSHLNRGPAGSGGFIVARDGHFVESATGLRVRFLATNLSAEEAFPHREDAEKIAARMAKLGINLVRMHHLQNAWRDDDGTIWLPGRPHYDVDPDQLDKLDYLIAALKKHGIYTNMNLSTTRDYIPELGFPESVNDIGFSYEKKIDKVNQRMIELQKDYAAKVLDRVNPHTGLSYREDPALAFIEINNENSLVGWPGETPGDGLDNLPEPFHSEVVALWNSWLNGRYGSDQALVAAWAGTVTPLGDSLVNQATTWSYEEQRDVQIAHFAQDSATGTDQATGRVRVEALTTLGAEWLLQTQLKNLTLENGRVYTLQFRARADRDRLIGMKVHRDYPDWRDYGLNVTLALDTEWQDFSYSFEVHSAEPGHGQIAFLLAGDPATIEIDSVSLRPGSLGFQLPEGQTLNRQNIAMAVSVGTGQQRDDWIQFLLDTERAYSEGMRAFLTNDLGFHNLIIDTQTDWGGLTSFDREASMEYADSHGYWKHPEFTGGDWDPVNWRFGREAMVNSMDGDMALLGEKAQLRIQGKPYSISEYNHPAPNDFQAEMMPLISTVGCLQDWDAFYTFAYAATGAERDNTVIQGYFDCGINPAKVAFYPSSALIFRQGLVPPADSRISLHLPSKPWRFALTARQAWSKTGSLPDLRLNRIALARPDQGEARREVQMGNGITGARAIRHEGGVIWTVDAAAAKTIVGFVGGQTVELDGLNLSFPPFGLNREGFASMTLVDHDGQDLRSSDRALLTLVGRVENQNMGWNDDRTSVGADWGHGPVLAEGIPCKVTMEVDHPRTVYALDPTGARDHEVDSTYLEGALNFTVDHTHKTVWYEIAR